VPELDLIAGGYSDGFIRFFDFKSNASMG
jgi:hypothetical protein